MRAIWKCRKSWPPSRSLTQSPQEGLRLDIPGRKKDFVPAKAVRQFQPHVENE